MRNHSLLALSLILAACSGDDDPGGRGGGGSSSGGSSASGGSAGTTAGSSGTGGAGGSGGGSGGSGGATGGSGGTTGGAAGNGGNTTGSGGSGGSATGGSGGTAGSAGSGTKDGGAGGTGGSAGSSGGTAGSAGSGTKDGGGGAGGAIDAGNSDGKGGSVSTDVAIDLPPAMCNVGNFPMATDFSKVGPFTVAPAEMGGANCTIVRPATLGENGIKHPVIVWGNGTGGLVGVYNWILSHWASHGFIVAAANTSSAGTGNEMIGCLDWVEQQNAMSGSVYEGKVAVGRSGASGHSQGGGGTIMAGRDPRIVATAPIMAYTQQGFGGFDQASIPQQKGIMLLLSALNDTIAVPAQNQQPVFDQTNVPVFWGTLASGNHVTFALGGNPGYLGPTTAWWRLHLLCDDTARPMFYGQSCTVCTDTANWTVQRKGI